MRRVAFWLAGVSVAIAVTACGGGSGAVSTISHQGRTYREGGVWTVVVPRGWHVVQFRDVKNGVTSAGIQLSNVRLPPPVLLPGFPIQVSSLVLPPRGAGLIIATDDDPKLSHGTVAVPPLPLPWPSRGKGWLLWSTAATRGGPPPAVPESLWFTGNGKTFIACAKVGGEAKGTTLKAFVGIIRSLRATP